MTASNDFTSVGYVGLGIMGGAMARNLMKAGFPMTVWNRTPAKCASLVALGAKQAESPAALAAGVQAVFTNVSDTPDVEAVIFGANGLAEGLRPGSIVIDNSTISPGATQEIAARLARQGVEFLDAPVSGGNVGAEQGTLTIMVGGREEVFRRCLPLFQAMGKMITHMGPAGMGQVCKACNQIAVAMNLLGTCEALALAKRSGLDMEKMLKVLAGGAAQSWQMDKLGPKIVHGDMMPGFMVDLLLKDLNAVDAAARARKLPLQGVALAIAHLRSVSIHGGGRDGTQALSRALENAGGFRFCEDGRA